MKFIALNNLSALHPWSAREARALWLWLSFLSRNVFIFPLLPEFSCSAQFVIDETGHFWSHVDLWCFAVAVVFFVCQRHHESYSYILPVSTLWYIICFFSIQSCTYVSSTLTIQTPHHKLSVTLFMSDNQLLSSHPPLKVTFCKTPLLLFQSMKKLQKSTLQGCQKKGFLCTLRQVYIERSTHCSHFPSENTPSPIAVQLWHNYTSRTSYYDQDLKSFEIFLQSPSKMVCLRETLLNARITWSKYKSQDISANPWKGLWVQF